MRTSICFIAIMICSISFAQGTRMKGDKPTKRKVKSTAIVELKKGVAFYKEGNLNSAKNSFKQAILIDPTYTKAYVNLGRVYEKQDSLKLAHSCYDKAVNSNNSSPTAFYDRGKLNIKLQEYDAAVTDLKAATSLYSKNISYNYYFGVALYKTQDYNGAIEQFDIVLNKDKNHFYAFNDRGASYLALEKLDEADNDFNSASAINSDFHVTHLNKGKLYLKKNDYPNAIKEFEACIDKKPNHRMAINNLGVTHMKQGEYELSKKYFDQAVNGVAKDSLFNLALNGGEGKFGMLDIISEYSGTPSANLASYYAGTAYLKLKDYKNAVEHLSNFKSDDEVLAALAKGNIGDAFVQLDQKEDALGYYEQAAKLRNNEYTTPMYLHKAGIIALDLGKADKALTHFKTIKDDFPTSTEAANVDVFIGKAQVLANK